MATTRTSDNRQQEAREIAQTRHMVSANVFDHAEGTRLRSLHSITRYTADSFPGYPCRQCLRDAEVGEELVLVSFDPFSLDSPYRQAGPIFLHRADCSSNRDNDAIPEQLARRQLSVRAFDRNEMMIDAAILDGSQLREQITKFFEAADTAFIDVHNATRGCWAARYERPSDQQHK